jgi:cytochrome c-type biogenesis protein CcmH
VVAGLLYLSFGAPGVPDQPFSARGPERAIAAANGQVEIEKTVAALEEKLKTEPQRDDEWLLLARAEAALSHWQKSAVAYRQAMLLTKGRPDVAASFGEMMIMAAEGIVTPAARDALNTALVRDPKNAMARYYLALGEAQAGNAQAAIDGWQKLAADTPPDSPARPELAARIADAAHAAGLPVPVLAAAAPGPSAADRAKAAQMTPADRQQMIHSMVEGLAAKMEANPGDIEGWLKLGRAYGVLGDRAKAIDDYEHAAKLKPDDPKILVAEAEMLMPDRAPQTPVPPEALALFKRAEAIDPKQPAALWFLGLAAAQQRQRDVAADYWQRLRAQLPEDSSEQKAVSAAIDAIQKR